MPEEKDMFDDAFGEDEDKVKKAKEEPSAEESQGKETVVFGGEKPVKEANKEEESPEDEEPPEEDGDKEPDGGEEPPEKDTPENGEDEEPPMPEEPEEKEKGVEQEAKELKNSNDIEKNKAKGTKKAGSRAKKSSKKGQKRAKKPKIKVVSSEENDSIKEKIKKIVVAKAEKAAEKDEGAGKLDLPEAKEKGTKEVGAKEGDKPEEEEEKPKEPVIKPELKFLQDDEGKAFIGRKTSVFKKYGDEGALFIGRVAEQDLQDKNVCLDSLNPHVVFVCGARGSGKSYVLGVIAEELALKNTNVGVIVVDPVGVFWGMKHPNRETRELESLAKWDLLPQGLENLRVFIPEGVADQVPKSTYDATFSMPPSLLTTEDWCLTFGIERFSPSGLLMEKSLEKVKKGFTNKDGKKFKGKKDMFSLEDLIVCLNTDEELNSSERGYKPDSIRALVSRFDAAKNWGVFNSNGTPLVELSREGQMTIIDTSFLEDNVSALVIGILARRILAARKVSTRRESASRFGKEENVDQLLEYGIPPTWLFIDEAHTLIPGGNTMTPASSALIEYVKQGRQPGCSLVFATQQPSAINSKVLSQLDIVISHKLVFDDDVKAVYKRVPTIVPRPYRKSTFIKTLPVGVALTADRREETSRAFIMKIRPRMSQHEGREAETIGRDLNLDKEQVLVLAVEMSKNKLDQVGSLPTATIDQVVQTLNAKYKAGLQLSDVLKELEETIDAVIDEEESTISIPGEIQEEALTEELIGETEKEVEKEAKAVFPKEAIELIAFPARISEDKAKALFNKKRKKRFLGIFGDEEAIENIQLRYMPVYKVEFNAFDTKQTFRKSDAYVNSITGEFLHFDDKKSIFVESKGLPLVDKVSQNEVKILQMLERKREFPALVKESGQKDAMVKRLLQSLEEKGFVKREKVKGIDFYGKERNFELPPTPIHPLLSSLSQLPVLNIEAMSLMREGTDKEKIPKMFQKLWGNVVVKKIETIYMPVYETFLRKKNGTVRKIFIEAVTGNELKLGYKPK